MSDKFVSMDEEGYFINEEKIRIEDHDWGRTLLENMARLDSGAFQSDVNGTKAFVEAFNAPLVIQSIEHIDNTKFLAQFPYGYSQECTFENLCVDEWDRFHGYSPKGVPFVFARKAQMQLFDLFESFTDETFDVGGKTFTPKDYLTERADIVGSIFWSSKYKEHTTPWDLGTHNPGIEALVTKAKLMPSQICVLGAGRAHDAAFLAKIGHHVTAVDFCPEAIAEAKSLYGEIERLNFVCQDVHTFAKENPGRFDIVVEHTLYCAITPKDRSKLVRSWKALLNERGYLLGVFFVMDRPEGPPYGGSEWEIKKRLITNFDFYYWFRFRKSEDWRKGCELCVLARLK
jgi:SAM-dependent methyltransferase